MKIPPKKRGRPRSFDLAEVRKLVKRGISVRSIAEVLRLSHGAAQRAIQIAKNNS